MESTLPVIVFLMFAGAVAVGLLVVGKLIGPKRTSAVKQMPYESGMDPLHDARRRFDIRFYLVAIAFLVFDVELLFLYPWAVASGYSETVEGETQTVLELVVGYDRWLVFGEVMVFMGLLALGLVYAWRKGVFRWR